MLVLFTWLNATTSFRDDYKGRFKKSKIIVELLYLIFFIGLGLFTLHFIDKETSDLMVFIFSMIIGLLVFHIYTKLCKKLYKNNTKEEVNE